MNDLEATRLCAEAMDFDVETINDDGILRIEGIVAYQPLLDDADAMELVKKFGLGIYRDGDEWGCYKFYPEGPHPDVSDANLNRAIVYCVAQMQEQKAA